jgi:hypothetical protein
MEDHDMRNRQSDTDFSGAEHRRSAKLLRFSPELTMGTAIEIVVLVGGVVLGYSKIAEYNALNMQRTEMLEKRTAEQEKRTTEAVNELRTDVKNTGQQLNDLKNQINLLDLKLSRPAR